MPLVQTQAGNSRIQPGQPGYFEAGARRFAMLEVPSLVDRSQGDVHPGGNPHIQLDPRNIAKIAAALGDRMAQLDAADAEYFRDRTKAFLERWQQAIARWEKQAAPLKGMAVVVYHKNMVVPDRLAWHEGSGSAGAEARTAADCEPSRRIACRTAEQSGAGDSGWRPTTIREEATGLRNTRRFPH